MVDEENVGPVGGHRVDRLLGRRCDDGLYAQERKAVRHHLASAGVVVDDQRPLESRTSRSSFSKVDGRRGR